MNPIPAGLCRKSDWPFVKAEFERVFAVELRSMPQQLALPLEEPRRAT